jgi:hypothetical protein
VVDNPHIEEGEGVVSYQSWSHDACLPQVRGKHPISSVGVEGDEIPVEQLGSLLDIMLH